MNKPLRRVIIRRVANEPVLWIIDSEQWPRAFLRAELIERGYNPYGFIQIADALESLTTRMSPKPEVIVLELRDQSLTESVIESLRELGVPTILLGGTVELTDPLITKHHWDIVLKRPFSLGTVADLVQNIVPIKHPNPGVHGKRDTAP